MRSIGCWIGLMAIVGLFASSEAMAACTEDARRVALDRNNVVRLKRYVCGTDGQAAPQIRVELHRLSNMTASLIVAKRSSTLLAKTIGTPKVIENEVFKSFAELVRRFGITIDLPKGQGETITSLSIGLQPHENLESAADVIPGNKMKILPTSGDKQDYPAGEEVAALRKNNLPAGLKFFYQVACQDDDAYTSRSKPTCTKYDSSAFRMMFWRPMRAADISTYAQNVKAYNLLLARFRSELRARADRSTLDEPFKEGLPGDLRLYQFLAGDGWPEDLITLTGQGDAASCGTDIGGIGGWKFDYAGPEIFLDALLIENASRQPANIGALFGRRSSEPRLRPASSQVPSAAAAGSLGDFGETLAPGQRLLVPVRIMLLPNQTAKQDFQYPELSREVLGRVGTNKLKGDTAAHETARFRDYVYGPELAVTGVLFDGKRIDLTQQAANFTILAVSSEVGSCPYLLSWDQDDREWIEHGKVLHRAQGAQQEYAETIVVPGFRPRFRLEEREAEVAFIDQAELTIILTGGETLTLKPDDAQLAARDGDYLRLLWGAAAEFGFELPPGLAATDVAESRLVVAGFYERYSDLLARADTSGVSLGSALLDRLSVGSRPNPRPPAGLCRVPNLASAAGPASQR